MILKLIILNFGWSSIWRDFQCKPGIWFNYKQKEYWNISKIFLFINTFQDEEITNEDDDWKLLKDFAKSAIADKSEYDLCKR